MGFLGLLPKRNKTKRDVLTRFQNPANPGWPGSEKQPTQPSWVH